MMGKSMLLWFIITVIQCVTLAGTFTIPQIKNSPYLHVNTPRNSKESRLFSSENPDYPGSELVFTKRFLFNSKTTNLSFEDEVSRKLDFLESSKWQNVIIHRIVAIVSALFVVGFVYKILDLFRSFISSQHEKLKEDESLLLSSHGFG